MASLRFKLPSLKVTFRPTVGKVERKLVYRDETARRLHIADAAVDAEKQFDCTSEIHDNIHDNIHDEAFSEGPTMHTIQK